MIRLTGNGFANKIAMTILYDDSMQDQLPAVF